MSCNWQKCPGWNKRSWGNDSWGNDSWEKPAESESWDSPSWDNDSWGNDGHKPTPAPTGWKDDGNVCDEVRLSTF